MKNKSDGRGGRAPSHLVGCEKHSSLRHVDEQSRDYAGEQSRPLTRYIRLTLGLTF